MASPDETPPRHGQTLLDRFPALRRLERNKRGGRIPYIQQHTAADCGPACLAMVLAYHGRRVRLDAVRESVGAGRDGASALNLIQAARRYNLRGRGVTLELVDLDYLPPASILHWGFDHFVVYEGQNKKYIKLVDPGLGPRRVSREEFGRYFTGVALLPASIIAGFLWDHVSHAAPFYYGSVTALVSAVLLAFFVRSGRPAGAEQRIG